jgi:hypothetical protein
MLKRFLFAVVPTLLVASSVRGDDDLLSAVATLQGDQSPVAAEVADADTDLLGQADVDSLLDEDETDGDEAVAACFRRYGGGYGSYGGFRSSYCNYGYSYSCYPSYSYCYTPVHYTCYTPVTYGCYTPCYTSYWGCW